VLETITQSTEIFKGRIVYLQVHDVRLANGMASTREVVHHQGAVAVVVTDDKHNVLLVQQYRLPAGKVMWEIPAGILEPDEEPEACAIRELQEETGYKPLSLAGLGGIHPAPGYTTEFIHIYWAREFVESKLESDEDEFVEAYWKPLSDAIEMITSGEITDSKTITAVLRVARELNI
jgi:ADP-ribose pyrophosphatase